MKYHVATNLLDENEFTNDDIMKLYHNRWTIEEFFKYLKANMDMNNINETTFTEI